MIGVDTGFPRRERSECAQEKCWWRTSEGGETLEVKSWRLDRICIDKGAQEEGRAGERTSNSRSMRNWHCFLSIPHSSYLLFGNVILGLYLDYNLLEIGTCVFLFPHNALIHSGRFLIRICSLIIRDETSQVWWVMRSCRTLVACQKNLVISRDLLEFLVQKWHKNAAFGRSFSGVIYEKDWR